jgi:hypothetical protein
MDLVVRGAIAGVAGVAVMTIGEKVEQRFTHRPDSYMPAKTLAALLGREPKPYVHHRGFNWAMHYGQGMALGIVRGLMAERGIRGPVGSYIFTSIRLLNDQTLENATGVGSLPWTWPVDEQVIDIAHKSIYAFATGFIADRLIPGPRETPRPMRPWTTRRT